MYRQDFTVKRGETFGTDIYFKDKNGNYFDLSGYTAKSQIRPSLENEQLVAEIDCTIIPNEGIVHLELSKNDTYAIPAGIYYYDLCLIKNNVNTYYLEGKFIVKKYITDPPYIGQDNSSIPLDNNEDDENNEDDNDDNNENDNDENDNDENDNDENNDITEPSNNEEDFLESSNDEEDNSNN